MERFFLEASPRVVVVRAAFIGLHIVRPPIAPMHQFVQQDGAQKEQRLCRLEKSPKSASNFSATQVAIAMESGFWV